MRILLTLVPLILVITACGETLSEANYAEMQATPMRIAPDVASIATEQRDNGRPNIPDKRMLRKTGHLIINCDNLDGAGATLEQLLSRYEAQISDDKSYEREYGRYRELTVRVPAVNFDSLVSEFVASIPELESREVRSDDVTEEFIDINSRLHTKKELEARYLQLLKRAAKVSDILAIERESNKLRSEIEALEGRLTYLLNQVSLSTLHIELRQDTSRDYGFASKIIAAIGDGWQSFLDFIVALFSIWPFFLLVGGIFLLLRFFRRRRRAIN
jgi:hypothetical protein